MTQEHPITPPPELVHEWARYATGYNIPGTVIKLIATQAARWGADQELEACCEWLRGNDPYEHDYHQMLRAARRPKPPSLKEQALDQLRSIEIDLTRCGMGIGVETIRRALESLPD